MQQYSSMLLLDPSSAQRVTGLFQSLADSGICRPYMAMEQLRPHVSLAAFGTERDESAVQEAFERSALPLAPLDIAFEVIGTFPATGAVFLAPTVTRELLEAHRRFHEALRAFADFEVDPYYLPGRWIPHCTLAIDLEPERVQRTIGVFYPFLEEPLRGRLVEAALTNVIYSDSGRCTSSRLLSSRALGAVREGGR